LWREITLRLGYMQSFLFLKNDRVTTVASYSEEAGFALASWVEKVPARFFPPPVSFWRTVHPTLKPFAKAGPEREPVGVGQPVPASAGIEPVLRDEPRRQREQREPRGLYTGASLSVLPPPSALPPEEEPEDEPAAACG